MKKRVFITSIVLLLSLVGFAQPSITITSSATSACVNETITFTVDTSGCSSASSQIEWFVNGASVFVSDTTVFSGNTFADGDQVSAVYSCLDGSGNVINSASSGNIPLSIDDPMADAGDNTIIVQGASTVLNGSGNGTYQWGPSEGLSSTNVQNPIASPESTTTYYLTVTSAGGCESEDYVTVAVFTVKPMNTITPNGDGLNDFWDIGGISNYLTAKVSIYDRWGQKVFNAVGYTQDKRWDGTNRGVSLPAATYYYIIDLNTGGDYDIIPGFVTIIK